MEQMFDEDDPRVPDKVNGIPMTSPNVPVLS